MCDHDDHDHHHEHPRDRALEPQDPMLLNAEQIDGDPEFMLRCIVEEFARMGHDSDEILQMFDNPFFQATAGLQRLFGADGVRRRVQAILAECGVFSVRVHESTEPEPSLNASLSVRGRPLL